MLRGTGVFACLLLLSCGGPPEGIFTGGGNAASGGTGGTGAVGGAGGAGASAGSGGTSSGGVGGSDPMGGFAGAGGASTGGAAGSSSGGMGGGGPPPPDCDALALEVASALDEAKKCSLFSAGCTFVDGPCCPVPVGGAMSDETQKYLAKLAEFQAAGCVASCPPDPCSNFPTSYCDTFGGFDGTCKQTS